MTDYYLKPQGKRVPLNLRVPEPLKDRLLAILRVLQLKAFRKGHDLRAINLTFVCERLLTLGDEGFWAETKARTGHAGPPKSESSWERLSKALITS